MTFLYFGASSSGGGRDPTVPLEILFLTLPMNQLYMNPQGFVHIDYLLLEFNNFFFPGRIPLLPDLLEKDVAI
jgi:hypothetical protein